MKAIENKKVVHSNGRISYFMSRTMLAGSPYRYAMHLSLAEVEHGRRYIAARLRRARLNMRESIQNLIGADRRARHRWARA